MAQKKGGGSTRNGRSSQPKYLGVKKFGGEFVSAGNIIIRQRGSLYLPGDNVGIGKDHTIFAVVNGYVFFRHVKKNNKMRNVVCVTSNNNNVTHNANDIVTNIAI